MHTPQTRPMGDRMHLFEPLAHQLSAGPIGQANIGNGPPVPIRHSSVYSHLFSLDDAANRCRGCSASWRSSLERVYIGEPNRILATSRLQGVLVKNLGNHFRFLGMTSPFLNAKSFQGGIDRVGTEG